MTGWGSTYEDGPVAGKLQTVDVDTMSNADCKEFDYKHGQILESMICAADDGKDACKGDSGGKFLKIKTNIIVNIFV